MEAPFTGGCACGAVRYEIADAPVFQNQCQCRDCQRVSGSGHGAWLTFPSRAKVSLSGQGATRDVVADSGNVKSHGFCPGCGSPVYLTFKAAPHLFTVAAASLDDPDRFQPHAVTYASSARPWDRVDPALTRFEKMPG